MAIDELFDEHEQGERVREWLRRNGAGLIGGIALGMAAIGGWKWWQNHQETQRVGRAEAFQVAVDAIQAGDKQAAAKVKALEGTYAALASLDLAKSQVTANQTEAAIATLRAIKTDDATIAAVVEERLARLLVESKKADEAIKLLADASTPAALEARADAHFALGHADKAREDYQKALTQLDEGSPQRRLVELKLTEAGGTPSRSEAKS